MSKKMMLLALSVVSAAMLAMPALASALPAHIDATSTFSVSGGVSVLQEKEGSASNGTGIGGSGAFTNTTTGTLNLTFTGVTAGPTPSGINCGSTAQGHTEASRVVTTTPLEFHLIMIATNRPGILITPNAATGVFAHFRCFLVEKTVTGTGIIGEIIAPACGVKSKTATVKFRGAGGTQELLTYTNKTYDLHTNSAPTASMDIPGNVTITFPNERSITCTH
ncbi:MAG TPA: hypothetical protein VJU14_06090 [Solirubrobacterales bacterium]|nr:hypothetical protein [Solirubrobacterales bacterium]